MKIKYTTGNKIEHKKFGKGEVKKIDNKDLQLYCLVEFEDSSKMWLAKWQLDKEVTLIG